MFLRVSILRVFDLERLLITVISRTSLILDHELLVLLGRLYETQIFRDRHVIVGMHRHVLHALGIALLDAVQIDVLGKIYILHTVVIVHGGSLIRQILNAIIDRVNGSLVAQVLRNVIRVFADLDVLVVARYIDVLRAVRYIVIYQLSPVGKGVIAQRAM